MPFLEYTSLIPKREKNSRLHRCVYNVTALNHLWLIDNNHKLIRWRFIILISIIELIWYTYIKKENVVRLPMRQLSTRVPMKKLIIIDQMTQKLTNRSLTVFNNKQIWYHIVRYKRPGNDDVNQFRREN